MPGPQPIRLVRDFLGRAEALDYSGARVAEPSLGTIDALEPVELLTFAAALTERMKLGSAVPLTALRNPSPSRRA